MNDEWLWTYVKQKQSLNLNRNPCDLLLRFAIINTPYKWNQTLESNTWSDVWPAFLLLQKQLHLDGLTDSLII